MSGMWNDVHIFLTLNYLFTVSLVPQVSERVAKEDQISREGSAPDSRGTGADDQVEARCKYSVHSGILRQKEQYNILFAHHPSIITKCPLILIPPKTAGQVPPEPCEPCPDEHPQGCYAGDQKSIPKHFQTRGPPERAYGHV